MAGPLDITHLPNIIYLHSHDTGRHVQPYGAPVATPRIQALAEQGVLFRQAFSAAPTCSPSRAALLTGEAPHSAGMLGLAHRGFSLDRPERHLVHTLRRRGYTSAMVGQQHVALPPEGVVLGYDEELETGGQRADDLVSAVDPYLARDHQQPFFLSVGFLETHTIPDGGGTFGYPGGDDRHVAPPPGLPDLPEVRSDVAGFRAAAGVLDDAVGRVLDAVAANGLADDTLVILTTDHGIAFPGHKGTLYDSGTGVMLIMRGPAPFSGGAVCDAMVSQLDLYPTLCDWLGIDRPDWLQGKSLLPAVRDGASVHEAIFSEVTYHVSYEPQRAIRTPRWKYIRRFGDHPHPVLPNVDDSPTKDVLVAAGWRDRRLPPEELYDLCLDPLETDNLAGNADHENIRADLADQLHRWMRTTEDPLLAGPVPPPPGGWVVPADALSPDDPAR